jgi:outer membrane protein
MPERENIKASEEDVNISKADYKPTITISGSKSLRNTNKLDQSKWRRCNNQ